IRRAAVDARHLLWGGCRRHRDHCAEHIEADAPNGTTRCVALESRRRERDGDSMDAGGDRLGSAREWGRRARDTLGTDAVVVSPQRADARSALAVDRHAWCRLSLAAGHHSVVFREGRKCRLRQLPGGRSVSLWWHRPTVSLAHRATVPGRRGGLDDYARTR